MKVVKSIQVTWDWSGANDLLKGFNVAITPNTINPTQGVTALTSAPSDCRSIVFNDVLLDTTVTYVSWVQSIYAGKDSSWVSTGNVIVSDDGLATVAMANDVATAQAAAEAYADSLKTLVDADILDLQSQVDGVAGAWFYGYVPSLTNEPAVNWTTTELKDIHIDDMFYDTSTGYAYHFVYDTVYHWERIIDQDVVDALASASTAQATADSKMLIFVVQPTPPYDIGDLWDTGLNDVKRCVTARTGAESFNEADWTSIATVGADWETNVTNKPTVQQIFYQTTAPSSGMSANDFWVNSTTNTLYRFDGATWNIVQDADIAQAISAASTAQATADGKIKTFFQTTAPTADGIGDMWFDTDDNNRPYRWSGSAWEDTTCDIATWSKISGTGKPADNADVTQSAMEAGVLISQGATQFSGTGQIKSSNYSAGTAGWAVKGDGSAEFNNVTVRGTLDSGTVSGGTVTGATVQTNSAPATNGGIKITGNTLTVYDDSGNIRVKLGYLG